MNDIVIKASNISKEYRLGLISHGTFYRDLQSWMAKLLGKPDPNQKIESSGAKEANNRAVNGVFKALDDITFEVERGDIVGVIGSNGAGKSTLLKILSRITTPSDGQIKIKGRIASLLEVGTGFHPELTGRQNIFLNGSILGMTQAEIKKNFDNIVDFADIGPYIDTPVKRYSSGMYVRLAFAVAAFLDSEILLVDEVLAVGDLSFQRKCINKMKDIRNNGRTILFVSHNIAAIEQLCTKSIVLDAGRVVFSGGIKDGISYYLSSFNNQLKNVLNFEKRTGTGTCYISDIKISSNRGERLDAIRCGEDITIRASIQLKDPSCKNISLAIGITSVSGEGLIHLSTETAGVILEEFENNFQLTCEVKHFPLRAGIYSLNTYLVSNGEVADWLIDCFKFDVIDADFYGSGRLPGEGYSPFLVDQDWKVIKNDLYEPIKN